MEQDQRRDMKMIVGNGVRQLYFFFQIGEMKTLKGI